MARFSRLEVWNAILDTGLVPLFYQPDVDTAAGLASACVQGGARVVEFTNRGEKAFGVFTDLVRYVERTEPHPILGVGSIVDAPTAALYIANGANFIVGPSFNPEIARLCNRRKIAYLPGCATETEIAQAEEWGAEICKIFPGGVGGPEFIQSVLGPCPWHRLMPTGGVDATEANVTGWIRAGAAAIGMGSKLITAPIVKNHDYETLASRVSDAIGWIKQARRLTAIIPSA
ncbi:MAG: bifunctional 4-hydroxy-2-oxoglutarate aldolase/2-dehydro-3-deoxy-phosphogluconate aldolase [Chloroflexi bacterium]|nr:bifunctional 4-hydroxy-2-oxoglutarate aldolase/2-dehydro-3-deoxy-phosphogluconate aldolase [Chloroflexota bacterium]